MLNAYRFHSLIRSEIRSMLTNRHLSMRRSKRSLKSFDQNEVNWKRLFLRPTLFTIGFTGCTFTSCSIWFYESNRMKWNSLKDQFQSNQNFRKSSNQLINIWKDLPDSKRFMIKIIGLNGLVFLAWKIRYFNGFIYKYFTSTPFKHNLSSMVFSTFSHQNWFHLFCNMYVLWSFSDPVIRTFGKQQFLALYLSSGVVSTWTSYLFKMLTRTNVVSLGASGSLMALIGFICTQYPDSRLCIIFIPFLSFSAKTGLIGLVSFDILGLIRQWKTLDHAAHLGGAFFGICYALYGQQIYRNYSNSIIDLWRLIKGDSK